MNRSIRTFIAAGAALAAVAALPAAASAEPVVNGTFDLPGTPQRLATGPDNNVWVTIKQGGDVAQVTPTGTVTPLELGANAGDVTGLVGITSAPDGNLYAIGNKVVVRWAPGNPAGATKFTGGKITDIADPRSLVLAGQSLFAASNDKLVKIPLADPNTATSTTPTGLQGAKGTGVSSTGLIYIVDNTGKQIIAADQNGAKVAAYPTDPGGGAQEVAGGPNGQVLFSDPLPTPHQVGRITPGVAAPAITNVPMSDPFGVAFGADGNYWLAQFNADAVARITPAGVVTPFPIAGLPSSPTNYGPRYLTAGPNNTVWVGIEAPGEDDKGKIVRITGVTPPTGGGGGGGGGGTTPDTTKPALSKVSLSSATLRAGQVRSLRFTLSEPARVTVRFQRALAGKRKGKACVKPTRALRRAKSCVRYATVATRTVAGTAAANRLAFNAKAGRKAYAPGRYRITLSARDAAGNVSALRTVSFRVLAPRKR